MFWNEQFPETIAAIDIVLQMPEVTVQDIVFEDDILQECKTSNPKLIEFLTKKGNLVDLVDNITSLTETQCNDRSLHSHAHAAYISCEILTCGVNEITHALFCDKNLIDKILSCLVNGNETTKEEEHNYNIIPLKITFIGKLIKFMHSQRSEDFFSHISRDETKTFKKLIDFLLKTIDLSGSLEILEALIEDTNPREARLNYCALLEEENIIIRLIDILSNREFEDKQRNAGQILCDIIRIGRQASSADATENNSSEFSHDPLLKSLESTETVSLILDKMFLDVKELEDLKKASPTTLVCGMNILQSILEYKKHNILHGKNLDQPSTISLDINHQSSEKWPGMFDFSSNHESNNDLSDNNDKDSGYSDSVDASMLAKAISQAQAAIEGKLHYFHHLLIDPPMQEPIKTTFGLIAKPLGYTRLEVIHLLRALISTNSPNIIKKLVELKTIKYIVDLFIDYPWNNLLHTQVEQSLCLIVSNYRRDADKHFVAAATSTMAAAAAAAVSMASTQTVPLDVIDDKKEATVKVEGSSHEGVDLEEKTEEEKEKEKESEQKRESNILMELDNIVSEQDVDNVPKQENIAPESDTVSDHDTVPEKEMASQLLLTQLVDEFDLIQRILPSDTELKQEMSSDKANFGHIVQIANYLSINDDLDPIKDHLSHMKADRPELYKRWETFIDVHVASFNATSNAPFLRNNHQSTNHLNIRHYNQQQDDEEDLVTKFFAFQTQEVTPSVLPNAIPKISRKPYDYFRDI